MPVNEAVSQSIFCKLLERVIIVLNKELLLSRIIAQTIVTYHK